MLYHISVYNTVYKQNTIEKWTKGCILPFSKKGNLRITKNYKGRTLNAIAAKVYNSLCFSVVSSLKLRKFLEKIKTAFEEITPQPHRFPQSVKLSKEYEQRIPEQHYCL